MANESWLEALRDMLGQGAQKAGSAMSSGADEISALYRGLDEDYNSSPYDSMSGKMLDRASEFYTGRTITPRDESLLTPMRPVQAGVSDGETAKALTKLADVRSKAELIRNEDKMMQNARLEMLINASQSNGKKDFTNGMGLTQKTGTAAEGDIFVGDSSGYKSGAPLPRGESASGSFTKSKKPIAQYDTDTSKESFKALGLSPEVATLLEGISKSTDEKKSKALQTALTLIPSKTTPAQQDLAVLSSLIKARDPIGGREIAVAMLRRMGRSQDEIRALFAKLDGLK